MSCAHFAHAVFERNADATSMPSNVSPPMIDPASVCVPHNADASTSAHGSRRLRFVRLAVTRARYRRSQLLARGLASTDTMQTARGAGNTVRRSEVVQSTQMDDASPNPSGVNHDGHRTAESTLATCHAGQSNRRRDIIALGIAHDSRRVYYEILMRQMESPAHDDEQVLI
jgi:hypothetical protein